MIRGDIVTVAARGVYSGKPRPALILQADEFADLDSVVVCLISTTEVDAPIARIDIKPSALNGLTHSCQIMIDKITTVPRSSLGKRIGEVEHETLLAVGRSLALFLAIV